MSRRTENLFQITAPKSTFVLKRLTYVERDILEFTGESEELSATQVTGERFEADDVSWALQDKIGRRYVLGSDQERIG